MFKRVINYTDYDDNPKSRECWFHMSKAELTEFNFSVEGGMEQLLRDVLANEDYKGFIAIIKEFILRSYGEKSNDGKYFIKERDGHRLADDFMQSPAYSALFMELIGDENAALEFLKGLVPKDISDEMVKQLSERNITVLPGAEK